MKNKFIGIILFFVIAIIGMTIYFYYDLQNENMNEQKEEQVVLANEINQLIEQERYDEAKQKNVELADEIRNAKLKKEKNNALFAMCGVSIIFCFIVGAYVHFAVLRPFNKLEKYADEIAKGNMDISLDYERTNYFGKFTWAFDSMRKEIIRARKCEKEAIENNKTIIASISHDIKTPIASIRAYTEGLEANMDTDMEKRSRYCSVIMKKCDEVSKLTNDLFIHSISDMDKIKIVNEEVKVCAFIKDAVEAIDAKGEDVHFVSPEFEASICADKNRLMQIVENLINNSRKYAKTKIDITIEEKENNIEIKFRDYGHGIPDEDMPFICDKFYRGKNAGNEQGSGLGLYIVKYLTEKMGGKMSLKNISDGFLVTISFLRTS